MTLPVPNPALPGVDRDALARFLNRTAGPWTPPAGEMRVRLLSGGRSNLTYRVDWGPLRWVLRRPPLGHVLKTAHDMLREARVLTALAATDVPVPPVIAVCEDDGVLGAPFYVMELVDGLVLRTQDDLAALDAPTARTLAHGFVDTLADLHNVDPAGVGLADFGRPEGYLERQVGRWKRQLADSTCRTVEGLAELADRLGASVPPTQRHTLVHGDYRLDNAIFDPADTVRPRAVLDWEMATLGDPLADLGLFHLYWIGWAGIDNPIAGTPGLHPAFPRWEELADRYAGRSGLKLDDLPWYMAFAHYKLAVILEGIHFRHQQGLTVGDGFESIGPMVPELVARGLAHLHG
ncbi:aminoglycoside phosphotransferase (APT) family kinase protein [Streptomyces sp. SAI-135]|uniref:phosphotransferase family protein n=1 Tax=unclassified Streptomyces TaxID=2593676 RepID=UPI002475CAF2|nr:MULTISPECIES: phosphotransferase family protein [unclassified Streptomyces]MDH6521935.1 aminoglycoside phosphotransferase (APT) family kinase protein [Streptomyces sp. SAI-090]MDH6573304.1 aminoglycoside phosphotransferase (APT) family kinase protein [Streptomyces sp. SAI-117]MDH6613963.1 aminoglycoside phosphotransferase (APT) family kinase protein [Streptomyces sp. SAI-135]